MDQTASARNISGTKQTHISGQLCKYTNVVKGSYAFFPLSSCVWVDNGKFTEIQ